MEIQIFNCLHEQTQEVKILIKIFRCVVNSKSGNDRNPSDEEASFENTICFERIHMNFIAREVISKYLHFFLYFVHLVKAFEFTE